MNAKFVCSLLFFCRGYVGIHSSGFRDFLLKPELLRAIVDSGFEHPSEGKLSDSFCLTIELASFCMTPFSCCIYICVSPAHCIPRSLIIFDFAFFR